MNFEMNDYKLKMAQILLKKEVDNNIFGRTIILKRI